MNAEHHRQLLAFFIVALAAVLLIGSGLQNDLGRNDDQTRTPAVIAAGPTISTGSSRVDAGGSARGTTVTEPASSPTTSVKTTSVAPPLRVAPGHSDQARRADRADQRSKSPAQKHATKRSARSASGDQVTSRARSADDGKKKTHAKKHGKKSHKQHRHGR